MVVTGARATAIDASYPPGRHRPLYTVRLDEPHGTAALLADDVIIATPAGAAADLLADRSPSVSAGLRTMDYASVVLVTLAVPAQMLGRELDGSGFLVPRDEGLTITACSWASSKWAHLASRDGTALLRVSLGHAGDEAPLAMEDIQIRAIVLADLVRTGVLADDLSMADRGRIPIRISRWADGLPQFRPDHLERVAAWEAQLATDAPGLVLAGAYLRGLGIPATIVSGKRAAEAVAGALGAGGRNPSVIRSGSPELLRRTKEQVSGHVQALISSECCRIVATGPAGLQSSRNNAEWS